MALKKAAREPRIENGIVVGTASNKYQNKNPFVQWALRGFDAAIMTLARSTDPEHILEVGCGEGHVTALLLQHTQARIIAADISEQILAEASSALRSERVQFRKQSIFDLDPKTDHAPLVVCCEVLEHLQNPVAGVRRLAEVARPYALLSVPREPIFRTLNLLRGAHLERLGSSPGHLQHWSRRSFLRFIDQDFEVLAYRSPVPWTVVLGKSRRAGQLE
jgi:SAM-dependent methyltransferase